mmetsp:Transcript_67488/g.119654  ORF Transcript_67488/g.119654 Transcript_67488/m.119654 type:complete len:944 (-) Transcript_67488:1635-4466(-)
MEDRIAASKQALQEAIGSGDDEAIQSAYTDLGQAFFHRAQYPQALHCFEKLLSSTNQSAAANQTATLTAQGIAYCHMGLIYLVMGEFQKALEYHRKQLVASQQLEDTAAQGMAYGNMGTAYESLEDWEAALECHQNALSIAERIGDVAGQGIAYASLGSLYDRLADNEQALHCHHNSLSIAEATGDLEAQATACSFLSKAYYAAEKIHKAMEYQKWELALMERTGETKNLARAHNNMGSLYLDCNDFDRALQHHQKAMAAAVQSQDLQSQAHTHNSIGDVYHAQGKFARALEAFQQALRLAQHTDDFEAQATAYNAIGASYNRTGNHRQALQNHRSALQLFAEDDPVGKAGALTGMGEAYMRLRDHSKALDTYKQALALAEEAGDEVLQLNACSGLGNAFFRLEEYNDAAAFHKEALKLAEATQDFQLQEMSALWAGNAYLKLQDLDVALEYYGRGLAHSLENKSRLSQCRAHCSLASAWYRKKDFQTAAKHFKKALQIAENNRDELNADPFLTDDQLLAILLQNCWEHHRLATTSTLSELSSMIYVYLWGLAALLLNAENLTPSSLPPDCIEMVTGAISHAIDAAEVSADAMKYAPYIQYYCMYILYRLSGSVGLRQVLTTQRTIDCCLECLAFHADLPPTGKDGACMLHAQLIVTKTLRNLMFGSSYKDNDVRRMALDSKKLFTLLACLPRSRKAEEDSSRAKQVFYILAALAMLVEPSEAGLIGLGQFSPPSRGQAVAHSRVENLSPQVLSAPGLLLLTTAICEVVDAMMSSDGCSETDLKALKHCFKVLHEVVKYPKPLECAFSLLDVKRLDLYIQIYVPSSSGAYHLMADVCKALVARGRAVDRPSTVVVECVRERLRSSSALSTSSSRSASSLRSASATMDTSVDTFHDLSSAYESLSSDSSMPSSPRMWAAFEESFDNYVNRNFIDSEDLFSQSSG